MRCQSTLGTLLRPVAHTNTHEQDRAQGESPTKRNTRFSYSIPRINPIQKLPERRTTVTVAGFFFGAQFGKRLLNLRKTKQRIVTKPVTPTRSVKNNAFGNPAKCSQRLSVPRRSQHAHEPACAFVGSNILQFAQHTRIIGIVVGVSASFVRLGSQQFGCRISCRVHARSPV